MSLINITRDYNDGEILLEADLDAIVDDIETFLNVTKINDDNIQDGGITGSDKLANASVTQGKMASNSVGTTQLIDDQVTGAKLAPAVAGEALAQDGSGNLDVQVDDSTIEVSGDAVQVKDGGITAAKLSGNPTLSVEDFTADGTFNVPAGTTTVDVEAIGGGGGGGGGGAVSSGDSDGGGGGAGGGAGGYSRRSFTVTPLAALTVTIGALGTGGAGSGSVGGQGSQGVGGTNTVFDGIIVGRAGGGGAGGFSEDAGSGNDGLGGSPGGSTFYADVVPIAQTGGDGGNGGSSGGGAGVSEAGDAGSSSMNFAGGAGGTSPVTTIAGGGGGGGSATRYGVGAAGGNGGSGGGSTAGSDASATAFGASGGGGGADGGANNQNGLAGGDGAPGFLRVTFVVFT